jgi:hypothetical protein
VTDDALALAFRTGLPFVGLRDHNPDPDLDRLIPPDAARAARVVPLRADEHHLRLAVSDPEIDLGALSPYFGDLRVELALAAEDEIAAILGPPPPKAPSAEPDPEPLAAEPQRPAPEPSQPLAAEPEAAEPEPLAAEPVAAEPVAAGPEPPEPLAAEPVAAEPEPPAEPIAPDPELDGEVPSWLEPPRRRRKVVVALVIVLLLLVAAAGAATAYLLTR